MKHFIKQISIKACSVLLLSPLSSFAITCPHPYGEEAQGAVLEQLFVVDTCPEKYAIVTNWNKKQTCVVGTNRSLYQHTPKYGNWKKFLDRVIEGEQSNSNLPPHAVRRVYLQTVICGVYRGEVFEFVSGRFDPMD